MHKADSNTGRKSQKTNLEIHFCGVGEAFDENLPNTSIMLRMLNKGESRYILLDCGFTAAPAFWKISPAPLDLSGVWISHLHGDHFMGLPQLLIRFSEHGRDKKLHIFGGQGLSETVATAMELAYPGKMSSLPFDIAFHETVPGIPFEIAGISALAVDVEHSVPCLGIRLDFKGKSVFYSGDGKVPDKARDALEDTDMGIFETFTLETETSGHSSVAQAATFARSAGIKYVAAVHMNRAQRILNRHLVLDKLAEYQVRGFMPEPGDMAAI